MLPNYPYPNISSLYKRSSVASERPYLHKHGMNSYDRYSNTPNSYPYPPPVHQIQPHLNHSTSYQSLTNIPINYNSNYSSTYPLYGLDWTTTNSSSSTSSSSSSSSSSSDINYIQKIALSTYIEDNKNKLEILYGSATHKSDSINFIKKFDCSVKYPITKIQWDPSISKNNNNNNNNQSTNLLATSSECLRIYQVPEDSNDDFNENNNNSKLIEKAALTNSKISNLNQLPPITSFDWNHFDNSHLITCSIDTTCTAWNLVKQTFIAKTQLIAHDSEVFDVKYISNNINLFTSCSSDGSVRLFDLRNLDQSTIIYENNNISNINPSKKLLRLATSNYNQNQIAVLQENSNNIIILDLRNIGSPILTLNNHSSAVNSIQWHPTENKLLSGGDDCQVLVYDLDNYKESLLPDLSYQSSNEINNVVWSPSADWVGIVNGKQFQAIKPL